MRKTSLMAWFRRVSLWCITYIDAFPFTHIEDVKSFLLKCSYAIRDTFKGRKGKKKRIPIYSFSLLFILFALNIGFSIGHAVVFATTASPDTAHITKKTTQNTTTQHSQSQGTASTNQLASDGKPPATICPQTPEGSTKTLAQIVTYAMNVSDSSSDLDSYMSGANTGGGTSVTVNNGTPTVASTPNPTDSATQQAAIEKNCEDSFNGGVNSSNGDKITMVYREDLWVKDTSLSECSLTGKNLYGFIFAADPGARTEHRYCLDAQANDNWIFPCSDINRVPNYTAIQSDWLSGDVSSTNADSGHFEQTPVTEPLIFPAMQGIGLAILAPIVIMVGIQLAVGLSSFRMANAIEAISRMIMGVLLIATCFAIIQIVVGISNSLCLAIASFHGAQPYPTYVTYPLSAPGHPSTETLDFGYTLGTENQSDPSSYRGIVVPISRWGCTANDFMKILGEKLAIDMAGMIPIIGNFIKAAGQIASAVELIKYAGEFLKTILSVMLTVQLLTRLVILNFYIIMAPLAFGCWGLPGGVGQNIVRSWLKGFVSVLAIQVVQVFMITIIPLLIPTTLPTFPTDSTNVLNSFVHELPSIAVLWAVLRVPKMLGTSATGMISSAGQMAGGAIVAVGAAAYNIV